MAIDRAESCADLLPIVCESCLGPKRRLNMTRDSHGKECKICQRPFTVFRWSPDWHKKTEICETCSRLKNVCQVCILDLQYGLPVQVRDTALSIGTKDAIPRSGINREFFAEEHDRRARAGLSDDYGSYHYGKVEPDNSTLLKLQRTTPYYKRNRPHLCSFYRRGMCNRGAECPYTHEMPKTGELSNQNIKDRYYGVNDPVARKLLNKAGEMDKPGLVAQSWMLPTAPVSQEQQQHGGQMSSIYYNYPIHTSYPSTDPQRMGAVLSSQEGSVLSRFAQ